MKLLLTGGDGFIGRHLHARLQAAGHCTRLLSRRHGCDFVSMTEPRHWLPWVKGLDAVINCAGIFTATRQQTFDRVHTDAPVALFQACAEAGITRVVQVSALGADVHAYSPFLRSKGRADAFLQMLPLKWMVLRPSLVVGKGGTSSHLMQQLARLPLIPIPGDGKQVIQPVHIEDVALALLHALEQEPACRVVAAVGPRRYTLLDWVAALRQQQDLAEARFCRLPLSLARLICLIGQGLHPLLQTDALDMLQAGSYSELQPFVELLGRMPQSPLHALASSAGESR
ncbi:NAD-dependent epimerase/dehydratase family protein [Aquitalea magnusonii]|uniref:NAD-dependent epimerase/dehydratase family protein n=1 Tax=Aquitalea magnusonii TaxID=332411 RepID=UPI000B5C2162|nr:NAD-dependent epimerase/dehydratase family protein [Aquitalea magnusonii]